jgi:hypothetical protein
MILAGVLWAACTALGQCPGGNCPMQFGEPRQPMTYMPAPDTPRPAWRYEAATGHRAAVVRVRTVDRDGQTSMGSGVVVRWSKRIVVLTARHVIRDAARVWVWLRHGRWYDGRVLKIDATWDVAVLDIGQASEAEPAELEFGDAAHPNKDDRLESCGYGPDGKLAVNVGRFLSYRTAIGGSGKADWMVLSGRARGGDSGGPIFNERGRVVGVLWGTDGDEVIGSQAGRLHVVLAAACGPLDAAPQSERVAAMPPGPDAESTRPLEAVPQVPRTELVTDVACERCLGGRLFPLRPQPTPTPAPQVIVQGDPEARGALQRIDNKLDQIVRNTAASPPQPAADDRRGVSPLIAGLVVVAAVVIGFVVYFGAQKG